MGILTLSQWKSLTGVTVATYDTLVSALLDPVQDAIESYCDRFFDETTYYQWFPFNRAIVLPQYPVQKILMMGNSEVFSSVVTTGYTFEIGSDRVYVTDIATLTTTEFLFSAYANITLLFAAVTAAFAGITFTITAAYATSTPYRLRTGIVYDTIYGAAPSTVAVRIPNDSDRIIEIGWDASLGFTYAFDEFFFDVIFVSWKAGYSNANMPSDLQLTMAHIIQDYVNASATGTSGLFISESLTNYSYQIGANNLPFINRFVAKYYDDLEHFKKKTI